MIKLDFKNDLFLRQLTIKIGVILIIVIMAVVVNIIISGQIKEKTLNISSLQAQSQSMASMGESFSKLMKDFQVVSPYLELVQQLLPSQNQIINFSKDMSDLADTFGVTLGFAFEKDAIKKVSEGVSAINFSMSLSGDFSKISEFIISLKESRYFIDFSSFDFTGGSTESIAKGNKTISAVVKGRVFMRNN
jgi:hypothetical protein